MLVSDCPSVPMVPCLLSPLFQAEWVPKWNILEGRSLMFRVLVISAHSWKMCDSWICPVSWVLIHPVPDTFIGHFGSSSSRLLSALLFSDSSVKISIKKVS